MEAMWTLFLPKLDVIRQLLEPGGFTVATPGGKVLRYDEPPIGHAGLHREASEAARCITAGQVGTPLRPVAATIATMEVMDELYQAFST